MEKQFHPEGRVGGGGRGYEYPQLTHATESGLCATFCFIMYQVRNV